MTSVLDKLKPFGDAHAINSVAFAIKVNVPLKSDELEEIAKLHSKFKEKLPRINRQQGITLRVGENSPSVQILN